ncbi:hypothetical protein [Arthrobacter zhaoguopingii]|uniref:hypothetical protein n=1 Tax=Arthrobacter zhaoguopingii TaxID=2681491 RepID=UPI00135B5FDD|nr:hypothetical protein [Arthrobacter zhaoguopingii]
MRTISRISLSVTASAVLVGSLALPASAADTTATVQVTAGGLGISAPAGAGLSSLAPGGTASATVAGVTVTDERAGTIGWNAAVIMTNFTGTTNTNVIPATAASYAPGAAVSTGTATVAATSQTDLSTAKAVQTATGVVGNNTATWDATLSVTAPANALADTYTAVLTHSFL